MKKLLIALMFMTSISHATYFRYFGGPGFVKQILEEACFNPKAKLGDTMACTSVPIITHSWRDGYILIPNEDWSLLSVGGSFGPNTAPMITVGPEANLAPAIKGALLFGLSSMSNPGSFLNLKSLLIPNQNSNPDISINIGVKWGIFPGQAVFRNSLLLLSIGPALSF